MSRPWTGAVTVVAMSLAGWAGSRAAGGEAVAPGTEPFALRDVRLGDGPFRAAMLVDRAYLLRLDPDRLIHHMRRVAGVPSPVRDGYGGWDGNNGSQSIGHYLSACSMMAAATGDPEVRRRVDAVVDAIAACQAARPDGAVFASRRDADWFEAAVRGDVRPPEITPWYLMHKNLAGLRDAWLHCGNARARETLVRLADACVTLTANLTPAQWQVVLGPEHGGPHEVLADVSAITGDPKYLTLARKFRHPRLFDPMLKGDEPALYNIHANTQFPKFIGYERIYELTGETAWHDAACHFWEAVTSHLSWVNGGNSQWEGFFPPAEFPAKVVETCGPETCNTYNMLKLTRQLFLMEPRVKYLDYYERGLYNHLLASQDPEHGGFVYYTSMRPGHYRVYSNEHDAFWCCVGTGMENHARYGELIYAHKNDDLYVNLFIASELRWAARGLTLQQETRFPDEDRTTLAFRLDRPARLTLKVRWPGWVAPGRMAVRVNGAPAPEVASAGPGSFMALTRTWQTGDTVAIDLPKVVTAEFLPYSQAQGRPYVAFLAGPVVLAAPLGAAGLGPADFHTSDPLAAKALPLTAAPALEASAGNPAERVEPLSAPATNFRLKTLGRPDEVKLVPLFRVHHERYVIYFRVLGSAAYAAEVARQAEAERAERELDRLTVDRVYPGDDTSESAHHLKGEHLAAGLGSGKRWRHAGDGWFSYELKVAPDRPQALVCTYWGPDRGPRTFDILVDGRRVATQSLKGDHPEGFFDVRHNLPPEFTRGRSTITVRFQAHSGNVAGGLFGLRVIDGGTEGR